MNATAFESALAKLHEIADGSEPELSLGLGMGQAAALLAKIEAADKLVGAVFDHLHDNLCTCATGNDPCDWHKLWDACEPFRNPQPAAEGEGK